MPLGPNNPQSSVRLSCTVTVSGLFEWTWKHDGNSLQLSGDHHQILTGDATRSTVLVINKLSYTDEGTYSCAVNHVSQPGNSVRNITLELLGELCSTTIQPIVSNARDKQHQLEYTSCITRTHVVDKLISLYAHSCNRSTG